MYNSSTDLEICTKQRYGSSSIAAVSIVLYCTIVLQQVLPHAHGHATLTNLYKNIPGDAIVTADVERPVRVHVFLRAATSKTHIERLYHTSAPINSDTYTRCTYTYQCTSCCIFDIYRSSTSSNTDLRQQKYRSSTSNTDFRHNKYRSST